MTAVSPTAFRSKWLLAATREGAVGPRRGCAGRRALEHPVEHLARQPRRGARAAAAVRDLRGLGRGCAGLPRADPTRPGHRGVVGESRRGARHRPVAPAGERWIRASSTGTALASTRAELVSARGAASDRDGMLLVGSVTLLGESSVTQRAAVWRAPGPDGPWTRTDLPGDGALGEAHAAACDAGGTCTVVGVVDGTLRGWTLPPEGAPGTSPCPPLRWASTTCSPRHCWGMPGRPSCWRPAARCAC